MDDMFNTGFDPYDELVLLRHELQRQNHTIEQLIRAFNEREQVFVDLSENQTQIARLLNKQVVRISQLEQKLNEIK